MKGKTFREGRDCKREGTVEKGEERLERRQTIEKMKVNKLMGKR